MSTLRSIYLRILMKLRRTKPFPSIVIKWHKNYVKKRLHVYGLKNNAHILQDVLHIWEKHMMSVKNYQVYVFQTVKYVLILMTVLLIKINIHANMINKGNFVIGIK